MSSVLDSGHSNHRGVELKKQLCPKRDNEKHDFVAHGHWPSIHFKCKYCEDGWYTK